MRRGFTIVELLFTLVILSAGLLALHGSSALTLRMVGGGWTRSACAGATSGSNETRGIREQWTLSPHGSAGAAATVGIELAVEYLVRVPRGATSRRSATFRALVPCA